MHLFTLLNKLLISISLCVFPLISKAQSIYPENDGDKVRYNIQIDIRKSYVSGICILLNNNNNIVSCIVNEFGISLMDFTYDGKKEKIRIHNIANKLNRWYVKRVIKKDLKEVLEVMRKGGKEYYNEKYEIKYTFSLNNGFTE